jgi:hypothetical protein
MTTTRSPLTEVIDLDAFEYLEAAAPLYLDAIRREVQAGRTPAQIKALALHELGGDRSALVMRIYQAARHVTNAEKV